MMAQLNEEQSRAVDIVQHLQDVDFDFVDLFVPLVFNIDGVAEYILANYGDMLDTEDEGGE